MARTIVLCSGGIDSILVARKLNAAGQDISLCHVDYGQISAEREILSVMACCHFFGWPTPVRIDVQSLKDFGSGSLFTCVPTDSAFFPHRNLLLLSLAAILAASCECDQIAIGIIQAGDPEFPDCSLRFLNLASRFFAETSPPLKIIAPIADYDKVQVGYESARLGIPFDLTYSCNAHSSFHCQKCSSCLEREISRRAYLESFTLD